MKRRGCRMDGAPRAAMILGVLAVSGTAHAQDRPPGTAPAPRVDVAGKPSDQSAALPSSPNLSEQEASAAALSEERLEKLESTLKDQAARLEAQEKQLDELAEKTAAAEARAADAEEAAMEAVSMSSDSEEVEAPGIALYGFADMAFTKLYVEDTRFEGLAEKNSHFSMGNVNLYVDANPHPNIRFLTEVRFTLYPHGTLGDDLTLVDNRTYDITSATGRNNVILSNTVIERAWIEWKQYDAFKIRAGYFLTPYGIWNVDHGSPTLISSVLPSFWASEYFPTHQTGVQVLGEVFHKDWEYGYRAYISNGRTGALQDQDPFKTLGGRVYSKYDGDVDAQIGLSGFWGKEGTQARTITSFNPFLVSSERVEEYEEFGVAADFSLDVSDLRVRTEFVLNQQEFRDGYRREVQPGTGIYQVDQTRWDTYGIVSYRLPWGGLEPFTYTEYSERPTATENSSWVLSGGLITHLAPGTQFKFQAFYVHFPNDDVFPEASEGDFPGWDMRLVTAF